MPKCIRPGCNNEQNPAKRWDKFCSDSCGAIAMGEAMEKALEGSGFGYSIMRPEKPEGEL